MTIRLSIQILTAMMMSGCHLHGEQAARIRPAAVAGQFYPADSGALRKEVTRCYEAAAAASDLKGAAFKEAETKTVRAVIVPHAGYVFSGEVAASAFRQIPDLTRYDRIFILGPSHRTAFDGASVNNGCDAYRTPMGDVDVDVALCDRLIAENRCFTRVDSAHQAEHCIEVQLPFLQLRTDERLPPIVPVIIGTQRLETLRQIAKALQPWFNGRNLFVISTDFSHYPAYADAQDVDRRTGEAIGSGKLEQLMDAIECNDSMGVRNLATSACGQSAVAILMMMAKEGAQLQFRHVMYRNSGDSPYGGRNQVVGYHSFVIAEPEATETFTLNDDQRAALLRLARQSIMYRFGGPKPVTDRIADPVLRTHTGAFVTLTRKGQLRGCIGLFRYDRPLVEVVESMARDAAFRDPRFIPVEAGEMDDIRIEVSVLTPLKRIHSIEAFDYGRQGIFIRKGYHSGTFLPQVAREVDWTKEEFLGHCSRDKAGLGWDGWKDAELYTYEAIVFSEP